ncbi:MAG TPA: S8 family serine peptidase [Actinomycetota bacterium]|nr:S8 family serine peptidase [Actinomycetota bacterium]
MRHGLRRRVHTTALVAVATLVAGLVAAFPVRAASSGPAPVDALVQDAAGRTSALVHVEPEASLRDGLAAARSEGLETGTVYDAIGVFVAYGSAAEFSALAEQEAIQYVEANRRIRFSTNSSHRATRGQDVLDGAVTLAGGTRIDGRGVGVAVVDSGVDGTHPDLAPQMGGNVKIVCTSPLPATNAFLGGFQECRTPKEAVPMDDTDHPSGGGHGTHVAGIVAGTGGASNGRYHGAAPGATIYGVSVGTTLLVENGLDGLAWVLENHDQVTPAIKVVNNSWGSGYRKYAANGDVLYSATWKLQEALIAEGVTVVFAAGNAGGNGNNPTTVAECVNPTPGLVCVANYDDQNTGTRAGTISSTSSRGSRTDVESWPDVSAPGTIITSTCRATLPVCHIHAGFVTNPPNLYASLSGTSMAAPHVAGIAAQLYQADPTLTPAEVENVLEDTAHKFAWGSEYGLLADPTNPDDTTSFEKGHGLVDALAAVQTVLDGGSTEPTTPPTTSPDPTATPTSTPTPTTAPPTSDPTGGTRYYFHSASGIGNADLFLTDGHPFDTNPPETAGYSEWHDLPDSNGAPNAIYDPNWTGTIDSKITSLTVDFWAKSPVGDVLDEVNFDVYVWVGDTRHALPTATSTPTAAPIGNVPSRVTHTYTTMLDAAGTEVPLSIDPAGKPVTIAISGHYIDTDAGAWIVYDYEDYPSGFVVGGDGGTDPIESPSPSPSISPTISPTIDPTTEPTPTPGPGRGTYPADPNDPLFDDQWGMTKIQAPEAWQERNATGFGVKVAVVDSGLDLGHPDFACDGKLEVLPGSNLGVTGNNSGRPQDTDGHGTHVAGIAGACTNNGTGVVGVAPDSTIMPVRVDGVGDIDQAMADGIRFATENGAHVINLSIGDIPPFSHFGPDGYPETEDAMQEAREAGVVIAAAAGNFAQPTCEYPSLSRNVICVVATDRDDVRAWYTDFPVNVDRNADEPTLEPVVAAPGGAGNPLDCSAGVTSTYLRSAESFCHDSGYDSLDGTSMASPHVAGVAALVYDRLGGERSKANADLVVQTILDTADDLYSPGWDPIVGYGRLNALSAVRAIEVPEPTPTPTPTPTITPTEEPTPTPTPTPDPIDTTVAFTENTSEIAQFTDEAQLEARLTNDDTSQPIPGAELVFTLTGAEGSREFPALTNEQGIAAVTVDVTDRPGAYSAAVRYAGATNVYEGSADLRSLEVVKEDTDTVLEVQGNGSNRTLSARVSDRDTSSSGVVGVVVQFFSDGSLLGTGTTNANGIATLSGVKKMSGNRTFSAIFDGNDYFRRSEGRASG